MFPGKEGQSTGGAWIIEVAGMRNIFPWDNSSFPGIDELHVPKPGLKPKHWWDYEHELIPNAWEKLLENMKIDWVRFIYDRDWKKDIEE
jgi:hypothetical protein